MDFRIIFVQPEVYTKYPLKMEVTGLCSFAGSSGSPQDKVPKGEPTRLITNAEPFYSTMAGIVPVLFRYNPYVLTL